LGKCARGIALDILGSQSGPPGVSHALESLDKRDRALVKELVTGVERWKRFLDYYVSFFCHRPVERLSPKVLSALRLGVYQMILMGLPPYAAIDSIVRCLGSKGERGFVNGVLRTISRNRGHIEMPSIDTHLEDYAAVRYSFPDWIVGRYFRYFGNTQSLSLLKIQNQPQPITLRANTTKVDRDSLLKLFQDKGYLAQPGNLDISIKVDKGRAVEEFPGYDQGLFAVQDEGAMLATLALAPEPGDVVWDVCAAPGGKTTHLAEIVSDNGFVVASDVDSGRADMISQSCRRLGLNNVATAVVDATSEAAVESGLRERGLPLKYDKILVDAPCSGLGVIAKNADIKWRRRESDIPQMAKRQAEILNVARGFLKSGGTLVYSTCTLTHEENEAVWGNFVKKHNLRAVVPVTEVTFGPGHISPKVSTKGGYMHVLPHVHGTDGFFVAKAIG
jgi:16S rRNA (cytosine967-C5)-methyltransferase